MNKHEQRHAGERGETGGDGCACGRPASHSHPADTYALYRYQPREGVARQAQAIPAEPRGRSSPQPAVSEDVLRDIVTFVLTVTAIFIAMIGSIVALAVAYQWVSDVLSDISDFFRQVTR